MKVILVVICINIIPALKCEEAKIINARIDTEPLTNGLTLYNVGKFRKFKKAYENDLAAKKPTNLYTAFAVDSLAPANPAETKVRVKKVLPFYDDPSPREKRSVSESSEESGVRNKKRLLKRKRLELLSKQRLQKEIDAADVIRHKYNPQYNKKKWRSVRSKFQKGGDEQNAEREIGKSKLDSKRARRQKRIARRRRIGQNGHSPVRKENLIQKGNGRRLIAARDALVENYPYVVSIQKKGVHWCSGALLNQRVVVTSANCLWRSNRVSKMTVRAGSRYSDHGGQVAGIAEVRTHPQWNIRSLPDHDVGLLLLDRDIRLSESVQSVDLPNKNMMPIYGDAWITSYGTDRRDGLLNDPARSLQVYQAQVLPRADCNNITARYGATVSEHFICFAQAGHRGPCTRDTGAPAVSDGILWGVASWGIRKQCGAERFPAMFSYLGSPANADFIQDTLLDFMSDQRHDPFPDRVDVPKTTAASTTPTTTTTEDDRMSTLGKR